MARLIDSPITVRVGSDGKPQSFLYKGHRHRIDRILEVWQEVGEWWEGQGSRMVYRVAIAGGGIFELDCRYDDLYSINRSDGVGQWFLYKVYD